MYYNLFYLIRQQKVYILDLNVCVCLFVPQEDNGDGSWERDIFRQADDTENNGKSQAFLCLHILCA